MAEIKIQDLSVGDWVLYDNGTTPYSIRSIVRTGKQECVVLNDSYYPDGITGFVKHCKPIPLTPEILEKNGFVFDKSSRWYICEIAYGTRVNVWLGVNDQCRIEVSQKTPELDFYYCYADIKTIKPAVHLLQHALRLSQIGKEIEL